MKLSKNGRKTQKAIRKALLLGLPVAGLLATAGCGKENEVKNIFVRPIERPVSPEDVRPMGDVRADIVKEGRLGRTMGKIVPSHPEEERQQAEEARRKAEEEQRKVEEEQRKVEEERRKAEEEQRKVEEGRRKAEEARRKAAEEARMRSQSSSQRR